VIAGLVKYPAENPFFIYHVKLWTLHNQASAAVLHLGITEAWLSKIISGLMGLLSFQALAMLVYVIGRDHVLAIGTTFVIFLSNATEFGVVYPIWLIGTPH